MSARSIMTGLAAALAMLVVAPPLDADIMAVWHMDEGSGATAFDATGNGNNGTLQGDAHFVSGGVAGGAVAFDGAGDYVTVPDSAYLDVTSSGTLECWALVDSTMAMGEGTSLLTKMNHTSQVSYDLRLTTGGTLHAYVHDGAVTDGLVWDVDMRDDAWHHIAFTWDPIDGVKLYVDYVLRSEAPLVGGGAVASSWDVWMGRARYAVDYEFYYFKGLLDEVKIYDHAQAPTAVPEPATLSLLAVSAAGLALARRRFCT